MPEKTRRALLSVSLSADAARNNGRDQGNLLFRFSHRFGNYGVSGSAGSVYNQDGIGPAGNARVWHDQRAPGNNLLLGAGVSGDNQQQVASADADWRNKVGQLRGTVQQAATESGNVFSYGGNFTINASQLGDDFNFGGEESNKSAVIVTVDGDADSEMRIFIDDAERSPVKNGQQQTIYLAPFRSYNIRLIPTKSALLDYDSAARRITVYPGNVVRQNWTVNKFYVITGRIITSDGAPLANAILKESRMQAATDDKGRLQTELSAPAILTFTRNTETCRVRLPNVAPINGVLIYKDALVCR